MSRPLPTLSVRTEGTHRTFAPGHDVVVGRDLRADIRIAHPRVSRVHLVLRYERGRWVALDQSSLNGTFVDHRRVSAVDIHDGQTITIGNPEGPRLTFAIGRHTGSAGRPPRTATTQVAPRDTTSPQQRARPPNAPPARSPRGPHAGSQPTTRPDLAAPTEMGPTARLPAEGSNLATRVVRMLRGAPPPRRPGSTTIGRAPDNDIVIPDVLASRHHATLVTTAKGVEIRDARGINGTFVNGARVDSVLLHEGDVVTIGNVDLVFSTGTLIRRTEADSDTHTGGLEVHDVGLKIPDGPALLDEIFFAARPGTLTAVIGPSGAGKSTLAKVVVGATQPTTGSVAFEGHDIHAQYASLRSRIGMVPQDDVVHSQLTVNQALGYAAELRLPPDTTKDDRCEVIAQVLEELELTEHAEKRVDKLSGGQRKRVSVAMELLTGPSLLILDEPTSGLDPALDRQVMRMLRELADAGRVVVVVTHSLTYLDVCDQVLLLAPGGKTAFCGPPGQIGSAMGTTNWADIFTDVGADPDAVHRRFLERAAPPRLPAEAAQPAQLGQPAHTSLWRQFSTIARRQVRLIVADRGYFVFLLLLPFFMGALASSVPGTAGFGSPNPEAIGLNEPVQILVMLNVGAVFMGTALTIRTLIGERSIFLREQAVGLSTTAYLLAKIVVFAVFAVLQSVIVTAIAVSRKGSPAQGALLRDTPVLELLFGIAFTCVAAAVVGLALSALARSSEQIMPLLVVAVMAQLVFSGGMIPVTDRPVLDQLSWATPARWGFAAAASTVDLTDLVPEPLVARDAHWEHASSVWLFNMAMLALICVVYAGFVRWKIRLKG